MYCDPCGIDHSMSTSPCLAGRRCCPRCGGTDHDGRTTAMCPTPGFSPPYTVTIPRVITIKPTIVYPEIIHGNLPR